MISMAAQLYVIVSDVRDTVVSGRIRGGTRPDTARAFHFAKPHLSQPQAKQWHNIAKRAAEMGWAPMLPRRIGSCFILSLDPIVPFRLFLPTLLALGIFQTGKVHCYGVTDPRPWSIVNLV
jgi:hypothetical protein